MKRLFWLLVMVGAASLLLMCGGESPNESADGSVDLPDASQASDAATPGEDAAIAGDDAATPGDDAGDAGNDDLDASSSDMDAQTPDAETPDASAPDAGPQGLTCFGIIQCWDTCAEPSCYAACIEQGSPEAKALMGAVQDCVLARCPGGADPGCLSNYCADEYSACTEDGQPGDAGVPDAGTSPDAGGAGLSCSAMVTCFNGCESDQACAQACFDQGDSKAQMLMTALMDCVSTYCADSQDSNCVFDHCAVEANACVADT